MRSINIALSLSLSALSIMTASAQSVYESRVPQRVIFEGKNIGTQGYQAYRSVVYRDGTTYLNQVRNQLGGSIWGPTNFQNYTGTKPGNATTQWIAFTLRLTNTVAQGMLDHIAVLGRLKTIGWQPTYDGRGVAMWAAGLPWDPFWLPGMRNERFIAGDYYPKPPEFANGKSHVSPELLPIPLIDNKDYRIVMHVNEYASAVWVYDPQAGGALIGFREWYTPNFYSSDGQGLGFLLICRPANNGTINGLCTYNSPLAIYNQPYKMDFDDINVGWF